MANARKAAVRRKLVLLWSVAMVAALISGPMLAGGQALGEEGFVAETTDPATEPAVEAEAPSDSTDPSTSPTDAPSTEPVSATDGTASVTATSEPSDASLTDGSTQVRELAESSTFSAPQPSQEPSVTVDPSISIQSSDTDTDYSEYTFEFADGSVITGSNQTGQPGHTGSKNEANLGLSDTVHVSCSDAFPNGWGEKGAPVEGVDPSPIVSYTIDKFKDGVLDKTCGETAPPPPDPNSDVFDAEIDVEKFVSVDGTATWHDADNPTGPSTLRGEDVWFRFEVTNTGDLELAGISLTDTDFDTSSCVIPSTLDVGDSFDCEIGPFPAQGGQHANVATATGNLGVAQFDGNEFWYAFVMTNGDTFIGTHDNNEVDVGLSEPIHISCSDDFGFEDSDPTNDGWGEKGAPVQGVDPAPIASYRIIRYDSDGTVDKVCGPGGTSDSDPAHYVGELPFIDIDVEKFVSVDGKTTWEDADVPTGPEAIEGQDVFFRFEVTNTGDADLFDLQLMDSDFDTSSCTVPASLAPGASFDCEIGPFSASSGQHENTATAMGKDSEGVPDVHDYQDLKYRYTFQFEDGSVLDGSAGDKDADIGLSDTVHLSCSDPFGFDDSDPANDGWGEKGSPVEGVDPSPIVSYLITHFNTDGSIDKTCGGGEGGRKVTATDPAHYLGRPPTPAIDIEKFVSVDGGPWEDADTPTGPEAFADLSDVRFRFEVTNTGETTLENVTLADNVFDTSSCVVQTTLAPGESFDCEIGPFPAQVGQHSNVADTMGEFGEQVTVPLPFVGEKRSFWIELADGTIIQGSSRSGDVEVGLSDKVHVSCSDDFGFTDGDPTNDGFGEKGAPVQGIDPPIVKYRIDVYKDTGEHDKSCGFGDLDTLVKVFDEDPAHYIGIDAKASIGDFVWFDDNKNGIQDPGEVGVPGVTVKLQAPDGTVLDTTVTDSSGFYEFADLAPGDYKLMFNLPAGFAFSPQDQGGDDTVDSDPDPTTGMTVVTTLDPLENDPTWDAGIYEILPGIDIEKATNGEDADAPTGPLVPVGDPVEWTYVVTNTGNSTLIDVIVTDNILGPICTIPSMGPGDVETCTAIGIAEPGQYGNVGTVTALDPLGGTPTDSDPSHYFGFAADIDIEKWVQGKDADTPPGPYIELNDPVRFTFIVTNTGTVDLVDIVVTDDVYGAVCTIPGPLAPGHVEICVIDDLAVGVPHVNTADVVGQPVDENGDPIGAPVTDDDPANYRGWHADIDIEKATNGEDADGGPGPLIPVGDPVEWTYVVTSLANVDIADVEVSDDELGLICVIPLLPAGGTETCTAIGVAQEGPYDNVGFVTGIPVDGQGTPLTNIPVDDADPSHYVGFSTGINLVKTVNGEDANTPTGPFIPAGDPVTWGFEVTNTGSLDLIDVEIVDPDLGGVVCTFPIIPAGATDSCSVSGVAESGQQTNVATVNGQPVDDNGDPVGSPVSDDDPANYFGIDGAIDIEKATNGEDADLPGDAPIIPLGGPVEWTYVVTNTGNLTLVDIVVTDNRIGDICTIAELAPGASDTCTANGTAEAGLYDNVGTADGQPVDGNGDPVGALVSDEDPSHYFGAEGALQIEKATNGEDADAPTGPEILVGEPVEWTYVVMNNGNVTLVDLVVTDDILGNICTIAELAPGASETCTANGVAETGQYANIGTVVGQPVDDNGNPIGGPISDDDPSHYFGLALAKIGDFVWVDEDGDGNQDPTELPLAGITVNLLDDGGNVIDTTVTGPDGMYMFEVVPGTYEVEFVLEPGLAFTLPNVGADDADSDADPATGRTGPITVGPGEIDLTWDAGVVFLQADIDISKNAEGPDTQSVVRGGDVTFTITVTNTGEVDLVDVTITDPLAPDCDNFFPSLPVGATETYECTVTNVQDGFTNVVEVAADAPDTGQTVTDEDPSTVTVDEPAIQIEKFTLGVLPPPNNVINGLLVNGISPQSVVPAGFIDPGADPSTSGDDADTPPGPFIPVGSEVQWTYFVTNTGAVTLSDVLVTDNVVGDICTIPSIAPGETVACVEFGTAEAGQYANVGTATGTSPTGEPVTDDDPSHYFGQDAAIQIIKDTQPDSQVVLVGEPVTFDITVTNTGNVDLTDVEVIDLLVPDCDRFIGDLAVAESFTYECTLPAAVESDINVAVVIGVPPVGPIVTDDDDAPFEVIPLQKIGDFVWDDLDGDGIQDLGEPGIPDVIVNLLDSNGNLLETTTTDGDGLYMFTVQPGDYVVEFVLPSDTAFTLQDQGGDDTVDSDADPTTGQVAVTVAPGVDDFTIDAGIVGLVPSLDVSKNAEGDDSQTVVRSGDVTFTITVTNNGELDLFNIVITDPLVPACDNFFPLLPVGATETYECTVTNVQDGFTNVVFADGETGNGDPVSDDDPSTVIVDTPAIDIAKNAEGPDSQSVAQGGDVTFTITVTNTGAVDLFNVVVSDPLAPACDASFPSLPVGASETYECTVTNVQDGFTNVATVDAESETGEPVSDEDPSTVLIDVPSIDISKNAEGPDTVEVVRGGDVTFTITVTNNGAVDLTNVVITDPLAPACDNVFPSLPVGATETYECTVTNVQDGFTNVVFVNAESPGDPVSDDDPSTVIVDTPAIDIAKNAEGPDSQSVVRGGDVTFTITVTNTGQVDLFNVVVSDPLAPDCDNFFPLLPVGASETYECTVTNVQDGFTNVATVDAESETGEPVSDDDPSTVEVLIPGLDISKNVEGPDTQQVAQGATVVFGITVTNTGDVTLFDVVVSDPLAPDCDRVIGILAVNTAELYPCTVANVQAGFTNIATVNGRTSSGEELTDDDPSTVEVLVPGIDISKNAEGPDTQEIVRGDDVTFTITVTNTGQVDLFNVVITDPLVPACDNFFPSLPVGATETYECTIFDVQEDFTNVVIVDAESPGDPVHDEDPSTVDVLNPGIEVEKFTLGIFGGPNNAITGVIDPDADPSTSGDDADTPPGPFIPVGSDVQWTYFVTNTGEVTLLDVLVTDDIVGDICTIPVINPGETIACVEVGTALAGQYANLGTATGTTETGEPVTDDDPSHYFGQDASIQIIKDTQPDSQVVFEGEPVTFDIMVTNTGNVDLTDVEVTDSLVPDCDRFIGDLAVGDSVTYECTLPAAFQSDINVAVVVGVPPVGSVVTDDDDAPFEVLDLLSLGDFVWDDLDGDGIQDPGEPGIGDVTVNLLDGLGNSLETTTTNPDGSYIFTDLEPGDYIVEFVLPAGKVFTLPNQGGDDTVDSDADPTNGRTGVITLTVGIDDFTNDAGIYMPAKIGDFVWNDLDADGIQDPGEPGIPGLDVLLLDSLGNVLDSTTTDADGIYMFFVAPGDYKVMFTRPVGFVPSPPDQGGDDTVDSDALPLNGLMTIVFSVESGDEDLTWDAGFNQTARIGDFVWEDLNGDGIQDPDEPGVEGVFVELRDGTGVVIVDTTFTDADGFYEFTNLPAGDYFVHFIPSGGFTPTLQDQGADDTVDSDIDGSFETPVTTLDPGEDDPTWDAGLVRKVSLGDRVWRDRGSEPNGIQDPDEPGVPGVVVELFDGDGNLVATTTTDADGMYLFTDLMPGDYKLTFTAPDGGSWTVQDAGVDDTVDSDVDPANGMTDVFALVSGQDDLTRDAGVILPIDIELAKEAIPEGVFPGTEFTYQLRVENIGDHPAQEVVILDLLPHRAEANDPPLPGAFAEFPCFGDNGLQCVGDPFFAIDTEPLDDERNPLQGASFISASHVGCVYDAGVHGVRCDVGDLAPGEMVTVDLTLLMGPFAQIRVWNRAWAFADDVEPNIDMIDPTSDCATQPGADPFASGLGCNYSKKNQDIVAAQSAPTIDLEVGKSVNPTNVKVGEQATFTVTVVNRGPDSATGVELTDVMPSGLTLVSSSGVGTFDNATGRWQVGDLGVGDSAVLVLIVTVDDAGTFTNTAEVSAATETDVDSTPGDGQGDDFGEASVSATAVLAAQATTTTSTTAAKSENLPDTGISTPGLVGGGIVLLALGAVAVIMTRRDELGDVS